MQAARLIVMLGIGGLVLFSGTALAARPGAGFAPRVCAPMVPVRRDVAGGLLLVNDQMCREIGVLLRS